MTRRTLFIAGTIGAVMLAAGATMAGGNGGSDDGNFCVDVDIEPFHMIPDGSCDVRDYWGGELQQAFYPFTVEEHLFNCEYFGPGTPLPPPTVDTMVPSSVISDGDIKGTIGGHPFAATLLCASLTNWYQDSCADPENPESCTFQLAQPFLAAEVPYHARVTEVSVFDGTITVEKGKNKPVEVPILMATRAAGITHLESLEEDNTQVGASITHSLLGMVTYEEDDDKVLNGSADLLLQGHIFFPGTVEEDTKPDGSNAAAVIKGTICSKDLYKLLNKKGNKNKKDDDDD